VLKSFEGYCNLSLQTEVLLLVLLTAPRALQMLQMLLQVLFWSC